MVYNCNNIPQLSSIKYVYLTHTVSQNGIMLIIDNNHSLFAQINLNRESSMVGITTYKCLNKGEFGFKIFFS